MTIHSRKISGLDLTPIRDRLAGQSGAGYWRSLDELAGTEEFQEFLGREFPDQASEWTDPTTRRHFLRIMGASLALAGVSGCNYVETDKIIPYVRQPEEIIPGKPLWYATAVSLGGYATGVLAESHEGRPTMVEGNPLHPESLGAIDPWTQASVLTLYDPDRSQVVTRRGQIGTWDGFVVAAISALDALRPVKGKGVRILTETVTSPSLARLIREFLKDLPEAKWHQYEPVNRDAARAGAIQAFGEDVAVRYDFAKADVILSLDSDFLAEGPGHLRHAREFASRREPKPDGSGMNRLYVVEPVPSITGSMADHRLPLRFGDIASFAGTVAQMIGAPVPEGGWPGASWKEQARWLDAVARDLKEHKGASLVVAGCQQPPHVHLLAHAMNEALGNVGKTVSYIAPVEAEPVAQAESLRTLVREMEAGEVGVLLIVGGNPAYNAPADVPFAKAIAKVAFAARLGLHEDETSALCHWHVPEAHDLESWGDLRASDGTATIQQPLIAPLYGGRSAIEVIAALLRHEFRAGYEIVRETWKGDRSGDDFETYWRTAVHDGLVKGTESKPKSVTLKPASAWPRTPPAGGATADKLEIVFRPDPTVWDGRFANNGWLQELPKPLTKLTWDNVAMVSYATAERLKLNREELIELKYGGRTVDAPVWIVPGHADDVVSVQLGYGRTRAGRVGDKVGFNAFAIRTSDAPWSAPGLSVRKTGQKYELASTQNHRNVETREASIEEEKRHLVRVGTIGEYRKDPHFAQEVEHGHGLGPSESMSLYPEIEGSVSRLDPKTGPTPDAYAWGMVVNLNTCIGCNACVIGCQAENNIPVVGKTEVQRGREMHWIDLDRYYHGGLDNPETYHQPRLCMHCENAPCELVCPVAATVHDAEGINNMVYNRCVGTRYCSNNCPYKVRHFNFFQYSDLATPSLKLLNNPDVTVRARGVMEKCTYCLQRINAARITAETEGRRIRDDEFKTACEAACPTRAITFGNINDPESRVSKAKADPRNYGMLTDLNTHPRTTYLARLRNPNPDLEPETEPA